MNDTLFNPVIESVDGEPPTRAKENLIPIEPDKAGNRVLRVGPIGLEQVTDKKKDVGMDI